MRDSSASSWEGRHVQEHTPSCRLTCLKNHFRTSCAKSLACSSWAQQGIAAQWGTWKCARRRGSKCCPVSRCAARRRGRARSMGGKTSRCFASLSPVPSYPGASDSLTPSSAPTGKSTLSKSPGGGKLGGMASAGGQSQHSEWSWQRYIWKKHVGLAEGERKVLHVLKNNQLQLCSKGNG